MRPRRPLMWFFISLLCFAGAFYFWRLGDQWRAKQTSASMSEAKPAATPAQQSVKSGSTIPVLPKALMATNSPAQTNKFAYRLSNTVQPIGKLLRNDHAILLENALIDTGKPLNLSIPDQLKSKGDPGSYIVQSRGLGGDSFRALLQGAGASIISYIPNNAYLARLSPEAADSLSHDPSVQAVIPFEPYYKLKSSLLGMAVEQQAMPANAELNVLVSDNTRAATVSQLKQLGAQIVSETRSPFGPVLTIAPTAESLAALAQLPGVQMIEMHHERKLMNDLARPRVGVAANSQIATNYLGLTGVGVTVQVNDTGVSAGHPDFDTRVTGEVLTDADGHGTHVAGIIAGSGFESTTVPDASAAAVGSPTPVVPKQFRGMAPAAKIVVQHFLDDSADLQEFQANTNAPISNNSWGFSGEYVYDLESASFDAAVRDALPEVQGSQPEMFVFAAGNEGNGDDDGTGGNPDTITSPGNAKNVITVGAIEQMRVITNMIAIGDQTGIQPWLAETDTNNEVASFSSRGNVGIGVEGEFGRAKPDVVAPGTFVLSTRSLQWDTAAYYNRTNFHVGVIPEQIVLANGKNDYAIFVPQNAVQMIIFVKPNFDSILPFPDFPIYLKQSSIPATNDFDLLETNIISIPPELPLTNGDLYFYSIVNPSNRPVNLDIVTEIITTNDLGNYFEVLSNLNQTLGSTNGSGPFYRFETGTSMATPVVSGTLALMEEFFARFNRTNNSPALMKALLINGARSLSTLYEQAPQNAINYQGWGLVNLTNSIPADSVTNLSGVSATSPVLMIDQDATNALATGQSRTRLVQLSNFARSVPLRITLAWTDPPGNPLASVKLVNDLDLVVTNLDTGEVFFGNDLGDVSGSDSFNFAWDTNLPPNVDSVNNIENVFLRPPESGLGTNYSITVIGHAVNVNAITAHTNGVVQDYALVISSGNGVGGDALTLTSELPVASVNVTNLTILGVDGLPLFGERIGASSPLQGTVTVTPLINTIWSTNAVLTVGVTNQWQFYVVTNTTGFTNAAFVTFLPPTLSLPRIGTRQNTTDNSTRPEADIDLYVSSNSALLSLDPNVLAAADKSVGRGGTELLTYSNSLLNQVYYVGVKSEDHQGAEYVIFNAFSESPFSDTDDNGDVVVHGLYLPQAIPDGSPDKPQGALIVGLDTHPLQMRRVVVTNIMTHENYGDLLGKLTHNNQSVVLNNHTFGGTQVAGDPNERRFVYEDNGEGDIPGSQHTDGPGSLRDYVGNEGLGVWLLAEVDNALGHTGAVESLSIKLEPTINTNGTLVLTVGANSFIFDAVDVLPEATNLTVKLGFIPPSVGPVNLYIRHGDFPTTSDFDFALLGITAPAGGQISINTSNLPPLESGTYFIGVFNPTSVPQTIQLAVKIDLDLTGILPLTFDDGDSIPIKDDAITYATNHVSTDATIARVDVGLSISHPRISDLAITLISPHGTRVLLSENRGGLSPDGMGGISSLTTNIFPTQVAGGGSNADVETFGPVPNSGTVLINFTSFEVPDDLQVLYDGNVILDTGFVSVTNATYSVNYGPGIATNLVIAVNPNGNTNVGVNLWTYSPSVVTANNSLLLFTENTNKTQLPIKFAPTPFELESVASNMVFSTFETTPAGDFVAGDTVGSDGWIVTTNQVSVVSDLTNAFEGNNFLALANGGISNTLTTVPGKKYALTFAYRGPGLVAWWRGESNVNDEILGNNGTVQNAGFTDGEVDGAFANDPENNPFGTYSGFDAGDEPQYELTNSLTIEGWVRPRGDGYIIFWRGDSRPGLDPYSLSMQASDTIQFTISDASGNVATVAGTATYNLWHHVAATLDGQTGTMSMYIDGVLVNQTTTGFRPFGALDPASNPAIGIANLNDGVNNFPFLGDIDEISLYSRALSASEILAIDQAGSNGKFDRTAIASPASTLAEARIDLGNQATTTINGNNLGWQTKTITFTATGTNTPLQITGFEPGMLLDDFSLEDITPNLDYVLPEQSLDAFKGEDAQGDWRLEIWDNRAGATNPMPFLGDFQLQFLFDRSIPGIEIAQPNTPINVCIPANTTFSTIRVDVPANAIAATNILLSADSPVNVWFNQNVPATGTNIPAGDILLFGPATNGMVTLDSNSVPQLLAGQSYFIGIQNTNTGTVCVSFEVDFTVSTNASVGPVFTNAVPLTNSIPVTNTVASGSVDFYVIHVPCDADYATNFLLFATNLPVNVWFSTNVPPSITNTGDFLIVTNATNGSAIFNLTNSTPLLEPCSTYYLGVQNTNVDAVTYALEVDFHETPVFTNAIPITNSVPVTNTVASGSLDFYVVHVPCDADYATNFLLFATNLPVNVWFSTNVPPSITNAGDVLLLTNSNSGSAIFNLTNSIPLLEPCSTYYLAVQNTNVDAVTYALEVDFHETGITNTASTNSGPVISITATNMGTTNGFLLTWFAPSNDLFQVQWTPSILPTSWTTFTNPPAISYDTNALTSPTNTLFEFFDDGSQTGGVLDPTRFYRLILLGSTNVNTAPSFAFAQNTYFVNPGSLFTLTNNATDADVPAQTLIYSITSTTGGTNAATIDTNTAVINWTPLASDGGTTNTITTVVIDNGAPPLSATNLILVVVGPMPSISSISMGTNGVNLQWFGSTNQQFQVEWTTNLNPIVVWAQFPDIIISTNGIFDFTDTNAPLPAKFYQLLLLP